MNTEKEPEIRADRLLTSYEVGKLIQVNASSVNKWVKDGRIPAFRTPGGHRRIRAGDLVLFLNEHKMPVPTSLSLASRQRLLVLDEDPRQLEAIQRLLAPYGDRIEMLLVNNSVDALIQVGFFKPHLVILDIDMLSMDGLEVCRRLKSSSATQTIRIIPISSQVTKERNVQAAEVGAEACLSKPLDVDSVLRGLGINDISPS